MTHRPRRRPLRLRRLVLAPALVWSLVAAGCVAEGGEPDDAAASSVDDGGGDQPRASAENGADADGDGDGAEADGDGVDGEGPAMGAEFVLDTADGAALVPGMPDTPAGRVAGAIVAGAVRGTLTVDEVAGALSPRFEPPVAPGSLQTSLGQLPGLLSPSPVVIDVFVDTDFAIGGTLLNPTDDSEWPFTVGVELDEPHRLLSFAIVPSPPEVDAGDLDRAEVEAAWADLAGRTDLTVTELGADGAAACPTGGEALAVGSTFKLYVLGAVATAVDAGTVAWDDDLTLVEEHYSLPSGLLQQEEPGAILTVEAAAELMLGISDNTATDHLLALVGREAVEAEQASMGHTDASLNQPFFTTRELFQLKLGDPDRLELMAEADEDERRAILDQLASEPLPTFTPGDFTEPTAIDVEWLASVGDLCRAIVDLDRRAAAHPAVGAAIGAGTGIAVDGGLWADVAFKGGSEPGVLNATWLLTHVDGRRYVVSATANDEDDVIDGAEAFALLERLIDLLAEG
ncbi:MAG: serine hydrolase [Actinomycetota bacterium]